MEPSKKYPLTLKLQVWAAVRNNPGMTAAQVTQRFKEAKPASVTSILSNLDLNDVIYSKGNGYHKDPKTYYTDLKSYDQVLAASKHTRRSQPVKELVLVTKATTVGAVSSDSVVSKPVGVATNRIDELFNSFTMNECKELYQRLHSIFGRNTA